MNEGKFKKWIKNRSVDGLFTEHYIFELIEEAKKEFPLPHIQTDYTYYYEEDAEGKEHGEYPRFVSMPSYDDVKQWFKKWFGE